jgi:hypothetical protein
MKKIVVLAVVLCGLTAGCTVRSERTVVEHPGPAPATAVVVPDSGPPPAVVVHDHY